MDFERARQTMVDTQVRPNGVTDPAMVAAIAAIPREVFVGAAQAPVAYSEVEIETSPGRALWTARDFSKLLGALAPVPGDICLVIGAGAGYEMAVLARLAETVIGVDDDPDVVAVTSDRLPTVGADNAVVVEGNLSDGLPAEGPFDVILVNGMVETVPESWAAQLSPTGRLGVVVGDARTVGKARIYVPDANGVCAYRTVFDACPPTLPGFNRTETFVF